MNILCGDIGGTKTLIQLCRLDEDHSLTELHRQRFVSRDFDSFDSLISTFLSPLGATDIVSACFGVAGPVSYSSGEYISRITNLPWLISSTDIQARFSIPKVSLINDFEAVGHGVGVLSESELVTLQEGIEVANAHQLIVGAGTGLGVAIRLRSPTATILPTEGGHADFAPANSLQAELKQFIDEHICRCSIESVVSGPGLSNVYKFICYQNRCQDSEQAITHMNADDPSASIAQAAEVGSDPCAVQAMDLFVECYGSQSGNLALSSLPRGGVYIAGGIAPKIIEKMQKGNFMQAFFDKSKMAALLEQLPVKVVMNPEVGLLGSQVIATQQIKG